MDIFKAEMNRRCDVGGVHCDCCNPFFKKDKKILNRMSRKKLKNDVDKMLKEYYHGKDQ